MSTIPNPIRSADFGFFSGWFARFHAFPVRASSVCTIIWKMRYERTIHLTGLSEGSEVELLNFRYFTQK